MVTHSPDRDLTRGDTAFFRTAALGDFACKAASRALGVGNSQLLVADVGCSTGEQTWSLGSALHAAGVEFQIDAFDNNTDRLRQATQPYPLRFTRLAWHRSDKPAYPEACLEDFVDLGGTHIQPSPHLLARTNFNEHNIVTTPLPRGQYDVVVATNILYHYYRDEPEKFDAILDNIVAGLRPGAMVIHDGFDLSTTAFQQRCLYRTAAAGRVNANSVFEYAPHRRATGIPGLFWALRDRALYSLAKAKF